MHRYLLGRSIENRQVLRMSEFLYQGTNANHISGSFAATAALPSMAQLQQEHSVTTA